MQPLKPSEEEARGSEKQNDTWPEANCKWSS